LLFLPQMPNRLRMACRVCFAARKGVPNRRALFPAGARIAFHSRGICGELAIDSPAGRVARIALAVAAVDHRQFPEFSAWLDRHQLELRVDSAAAEACRRVDAQAFVRAFESDRVKRRLAADIALARRLKLTRVPRLVLPGGIVEGHLTRDNLPA